MDALAVAIGTSHGAYNFGREPGPNLNSFSPETTESIIHVSASVAGASVPREEQRFPTCLHPIFAPPLGRPRPGNCRQDSSTG